MTVQSFQPADLTPMSAAVGLADLPAEMAAIVQWANTAGAAQALIERIVDTPFMPAVFWPKFDSRDREAAQHARQQAIASGTAAVLYGGPLGLNPLQSLANIHVVKGKPGLYAETMVALVRSHGHEVGVEELTDHRCRVWGRRSGEEQVHRAEFTIDRAKRAGYVAQNQKYGTDPQSMLYPRAVSILCRQMAPEVLKGLAIVEEIGDEPDADAPATRGTRTVKRAEQPAVVDLRDTPKLPSGPAGNGPAVGRNVPAERTAPAAPPAAQSGPPLPGEEEQPSVVQGAPSAIDEKTWRQINARFVEIGGQVRGLTGPGQSEARMRVVCHIIDRRVTKGSELTAQEGYDVASNLAGASGVELCRSVLAPAADETPAAAAAAVEHAATIDEQIAAASADADARDAQRAAEQAQADEVDPTVGEEWPA